MSAKAASGRAAIQFDPARGQWHAYVSMGTNAQGKRVRRHVRGNTQREVRTEVSRLEQERDSGALAGGGSISVNDWLISWVRGQTVKVAASTLSGYTYDLRYIAKSIGAIRLDKMTPEDVERLYRDMLAAGYAPGSVLHTKRTLSAALQTAVDRGRMVRNPVKLAAAPKDRPPEIEPLTKEKARELLDHAAGLRNGARWVIALALGLRQGETLGLQWRDLELDSGTLHIRRQLRRVVWEHGCKNPLVCSKRGCDCPQRFGGGLVLSEPKSEAGKRTIALPAPVVPWLREHRAAQAAERLRAGELWDQAQPRWIFASEIGKPLDPRRDLTRWKELLLATGLADCWLHDARHTAATLLLVAGVPDRMVMNRLGWTSGALLSRYSHVVDEVKRKAAQSMSEMLWPRDIREGGRCRLGPRRPTSQG
jgi:integrase